MFRKKIPVNKFVKLLTLSNIKASDHTLRKLYFHFLSNWIGYDRGDNFPFKFEPNEIPFDSKSKGKLSPLSYPIQCERKWKYSFLSEDWNFDITVREVFISHDDWGPRWNLSVPYCHDVMWFQGALSWALETLLSRPIVRLIWMYKLKTGPI